MKKKLSFYHEGTWIHLEVKGNYAIDNHKNRWILIKGIWYEEFGNISYNPNEDKKAA